MSPSEVAMVDFSFPGSVRISPTTARMRELEPGGPSILYQHRDKEGNLLKTKFSVWIATRRQRLGKPFRWRATDNLGEYEIWLD